ncbi:hypothetical protein JCM19046_4923 [Bacillus sp. JCM 19046]|uniref:Uncharacterized protein n=1 Tax=Shouchella xiaoxiensis TaxID=766895 RepID=A0ABS2T099_9BACI|nr:hypothetical protein [Shouchella xiaoxiensis]MBM7841204.1 hypothetical protein [Shouchella xiaoxiensis]GAF14095.1 hypothetical protein JCM19045_3384 [Bacillus sp. JCM 19045]GAF20216.1 hypothetical protein JCM19046_4923 [Bacillus sp. JCM 19046]
MAEYIHYETEKKKMDALMAEGYSIQSITDHLNGSDVVFVNDQHQRTVTLGNANARKYASTLYFHKRSQVG